MLKDLRELRAIISGYNYDDKESCQYVLDTVKKSFTKLLDDHYPLNLLFYCYIKGVIIEQLLALDFFIAQPEEIYSQRQEFIRHSLRYHLLCLIYNYLFAYVHFHVSDKNK
jgi:hypothetical protein